MSNNFMRGSLFFISGAAIASFVTYKIVEKKFKKIADEEIASVKEMYERKLKNITVTKDEIDNEIRVVEVSEEGVTELTPIKVNPYGALVSDLGYSNNKKEEEDMTDINIEVIPPEDFGEYGYKCESLTYYADKVLAYSNDEVVTESDKIIGPNALNTFGEYEDDSVFVRNHGMKTDFEILLDTRKYSNVVGNPVEDTDDAE